MYKFNHLKTAADDPKGREVDAYLIGLCTKAKEISGEFALDNERLGRTDIRTGLVERLVPLVLNALKDFPQGDHKNVAIHYVIPNIEGGLHVGAPGNADGAMEWGKGFLKNDPRLQEIMRLVLMEALQQNFNDRGMTETPTNVSDHLRSTVQRQIEDIQPDAEA